nr:hypothetical protein [Dendrosporobacter quercicolus]
MTRTQDGRILKSSTIYIRTAPEKLRVFSLLTTISPAPE